jgi:hypothetical protein
MIDHEPRHGRARVIGPAGNADPQPVRSSVEVVFSQGVNPRRLLNNN